MMTKAVLYAAARGSASRSLQSLHQRLLRFQAIQSGFNGSPLQLFDLASKNSAFTWLKPLREAIVALDNRRADPEPISEKEIEAFRNQCQSLLNAESGPLATELKTAFQFDPETIWAVSSARKALAPVS